MTIAIILLLVGLAAANGANDVSKGVATLAGAGVTAYRTAIAWGAAATFGGAMLSISLGRGMGKLFSKGIVSATPTSAFALAVLVGATSWVALASIVRLPVSTTHAIVGSLIGAGLVLRSSAVQWNGLTQKVVQPLLLSILVAYLVCAVLVVVTRSAVRRTGRTPAAAIVPPDPADPVTPAAPSGGVATLPAQSASATRTRAPLPLMDVLHWLSSGAASCARGLNDTPKIAAIGGFALVPAGYSATSVTVIVACAMLAGSALGIRVARTLGEKVTKVNHAEGLLGNLTTATLVGLGALRSWPMSTTHVSTGAIAGTAGFNVKRLSGHTLRNFAIAWTVTPVFAGLVAAGVFALAR